MKYCCGDYSREEIIDRTVVHIELFGEAWDPHNFDILNFRFKTRQRIAWQKKLKLEVPNLVGALISASVNLCVMQHP